MPQADLGRFCMVFGLYLNFLTTERVVENYSKLMISFTSFLDRNREGQLGVHKALRSPNNKRYITQNYSW